MSLKLHGVELSLQDMGNVLLVFLQGEPDAVQNMYYSLWNWSATSADFQEMSDTCGYIVIHGNNKPEVAHYKLSRALKMGALAEILNSENTKGTNPMLRAQKIADERLAAMDKVRWYKPIADLGDIYMMGDSIKAERETGNFDDDVLGASLDRSVEITN
jgi:hypothetical protein